MVIESGSSKEKLYRISERYEIYKNLWKIGKFFLVKGLFSYIA